MIAHKKWLIAMALGFFTIKGCDRGLQESRLLAQRDRKRQTSEGSDRSVNSPLTGRNRAESINSQVTLSASSSSIPLSTISQSTIEMPYASACKLTMEILFPKITSIRTEILNRHAALSKMESLQPLNYYEILSLLFPEQNKEKHNTPFTQFNDLSHFHTLIKPKYSVLNPHEEIVATTLEALVNDAKIADYLDEDFIESPYTVVQICNSAAKMAKARIMPGTHNLYELLHTKINSAVTMYENVQKSLTPSAFPYGKMVERDLYTTLKLTEGAHHLFKMARKGSPLKYTEKKQENSPVTIERLTIPNESHEWLKELVNQDPKAIENLDIANLPSDIPSCSEDDDDTAATDTHLCSSPKLESRKIYPNDEELEATILHVKSNDHDTDEDDNSDDDE